MPTDLPRLLNTLWGAFLDTAGSFSCIEIEAIADLYRDIGWTEAQVRPLLVAHAEDDDEGDRHWGLLNFGCYECDYTGLHVNPGDIGKPVIAVERHDACGSLEYGDLEAAAFIAYCHPQYRQISYRTSTGTTFTMPVEAWRADFDFPAIGFAQPVLLSTTEGHIQALLDLKDPT